MLRHRLEERYTRNFLILIANIEMFVIS
jgi:hypothetical protein